MRTSPWPLNLMLCCATGWIGGCYNSVSLSDAGAPIPSDAESANGAPDAAPSEFIDAVTAGPDASPSDAVTVIRSVGCVATEQSGPFTSNYDAGQPPTLEVFVTEPGVAVFQDGVLKLIPSTAIAAQYASAHTIPADNFRRRRVASEVLAMVNIRRPIDVFVSIYSAAQPRTFLEISQLRGFIRANSWVSGERSELVSIPFDPVAHRWWQLREDAGTVSFETSADGLDWAPLTTTPTPAWYVDAFLAFEMYLDRSTMSTDLGQVVFDNTYDCKQL